MKLLAAFGDLAGVFAGVVATADCGAATAGAGDGAGTLSSTGLRVVTAFLVPTDLLGGVGVDPIEPYNCAIHPITLLDMKRGAWQIQVGYNKNQ